MFQINSIIIFEVIVKKKFDATDLPPPSHM